MSKMKLAIFGLFVLMAVAANAMTPGDRMEAALRRLDDPYYMDLHGAIYENDPAAFMKALNKMDAEGHALAGEDYDELKTYAQAQDFDIFGATEDNTYQKLSAAVLNDDFVTFSEHLVAGAHPTTEHLFWLLDLARKKESQVMVTILSDELVRRGIHID